MTLDQFLAQQHNRLDCFREYYLQSRREEGSTDSWPLEMMFTEWLEQFDIYQS
jgi:hypothetical protein